MIVQFYLYNYHIIINTIQLYFFALDIVMVDSILSTILNLASKLMKLLVEFNEFIHQHLKTFRSVRIIKNTL